MYGEMGTVDGKFISKTAVPQGCGITEILPPPELRQYIRCFWRYDDKVYSGGLRIIPDCCADIIIPLDGSRAVFVGASDRSFISKPNSGIFGIRFYSWAVSAFLHINLESTFNEALFAGDVLHGFAELRSKITSEPDFIRQTEYACAYFTRLFDGNLDADVMNALYCAVINNCRTTVEELAAYTVISRRTLERKFIERVGSTPKTILKLLRYQLLWQDCMKKDFVAADSAFKLGFYDEAHMYNDFKRLHGISLSRAREEYFALSQIYNTAKNPGGIIRKNEVSIYDRIEMRNIVQ